MSAIPNQMRMAEIVTESLKTKLPAEDETVGQLTRIWQDLIGVAPIGIDQNFFDLGGDSPLAVHLFAQIEKVFNVKLPLATLFEAPTIGELSLILQREAAPSGWSPLVAIQTAGSRPPFFCIHGAGGNVLIYRDLSRHLGNDQPFYGLQSQGLDGSCPLLTTIEEMAALYAKEIRRLRPHGPYFLGGYCMGGTIAYEVAQQLQSAGEKVALLALFDTMNWCKVPLPSIFGKGVYHGQRLIFHAANFLNLDTAGRAKFLSEKVKAFRSRIPVWRGKLLSRLGSKSPAGASESLVLGQVWQANDRACMNYFPKPLAGVITDFRPLEQYAMYNKPDVKWDRLAQAGQKIVVLPSYPAGMIVEPFVKHLATALADAMDCALRGDDLPLKTGI